MVTTRVAQDEENLQRVILVINDITCEQMGPDGGKHRLMDLVCAWEWSGAGSSGPPGYTTTTILFKRRFISFDNLKEEMQFKSEFS